MSMDNVTANAVEFLNDWFLYYEGLNPVCIELAGSVDVNDFPYTVFKFKRQDSEEWLLGASTLESYDYLLEKSITCTEYKPFRLETVEADVNRLVDNYIAGETEYPGDDSAISSMNHWLLHPNEYGAIPECIEVVGTFQYGLITFAVLKFRKENIPACDWHIGITSCGVRYPELDMPVTWSDFVEYDEETVMEDAYIMLENLIDRCISSCMGF